MEKRYGIAAGPPPTIERRAGSETWIRGTASVFYDGLDTKTQFEILPGLMERISPKAFDRALSERQITKCLLNHDPNFLLGCTDANTVQLWTDKKGLQFRCCLPDTTAGHDTLKLIKRGDLKGCSFGFTVRKHSFSKERDNDVRLVEDVRDLLDVSVVAYPAYKATAVGVSERSDRERLKREWDQWRRDSRPAPSYGTDRESVAVRLRLLQLDMDDLKHSLPSRR